MLGCFANVRSREAALQRLAAMPKSAMGPEAALDTMGEKPKFAASGWACNEEGKAVIQYCIRIVCILMVRSSANNVLKAKFAVFLC
jgi:hypothetical protein